MDKIENIEEAVKNSIKISSKDEMDECQKFDVDLIAAMNIEGKICKGGKLTITGKLLGIPFRKETIDISKRHFCLTENIMLEEIQVCFYMVSSCLKFKGYFDGVFHDAKTWDVRVLCF